MLRLGLTIVCLMMINIVSLRAEEVNTKDIEEAIKQEFVEQGLTENIELEIFGGETNFDYEKAQKVKILISELEANQENNKFEAKAEIFADGELKDKENIVGRFFVLEKIAVLKHDIHKEDMIKKEDIAIINFRSNRLKEDIVKDINELEGMQANRNIKAYKPISTKDIKREVVIKKGKIVTVVYKNKGLQITTKAEALTDGAKGQKIKLSNVNSDKEIIAEVVNGNVVEINAK